MDSKASLVKNSINRLVLEGATYASITLVENNNIILFQSSNHDWNNKFHETNYSSQCHLMKAAKKMSENYNNFSLFWDMVQPDNDIAIYLNDMRNSYNICHGVSLCFNINNISYFIALASNYFDKSFPKAVIESKHIIFEELKKINNLEQIKT